MLFQSLYVVSWTGGYESPSYDVFWSEEKAWEKAHEWAVGMDEEHDQIDVLRIRLVPMLSVERLEQPA